MVNKYTIISFAPIWILFLIYIVASIIYKDWKAIIYTIITLIGVFLFYKWFRYWDKKEDEKV